LIGILINKQENNITKQLVKNPILLQKKTQKKTNKQIKQKKKNNNGRIRLQEKFEVIKGATQGVSQRR
jgi:hypothetical protein